MILPGTRVGAGVGRVPRHRDTRVCVALLYLSSGVPAQTQGKLVVRARRGGGGVVWLMLGMRGVRSGGKGTSGAEEERVEEPHRCRGLCEVQVFNFRGFLSSGYWVQRVQLSRSQG